MQGSKCHSKHLLICVGCIVPNEMRLSHVTLNRGAYNDDCEDTLEEPQSLSGSGLVQFAVFPNPCLP